MTKSRMIRNTILLLICLLLVILILISIGNIKHVYLIGRNFGVLGIVVGLCLILPAIVLTTRYSVLKVLRWLLLILNIIVIGIVSTSYFFGFDLEWGFNQPALTWGLPLLIVCAGSIVTLIFNITLKKWLLSIITFIFCILGIFYFNILLSSHETVFLDYSNEPSQNAALTEEEKIIVLLLENRKPDETGYYKVVKPEVSIDNPIFPNSDGINILKTELKSNSNLKNINFDPALIDQFFEINKNPCKLNIASNPQAGYFIDYAGQFDNYDWKGIHSFHPRVGAKLRISLPVFDPQTGYILIYEGWSFDSLMGVGRIYAYKYENGKIGEAIPVIELGVS
jgi:hypothetical protein